LLDLAIVMDVGLRKLSDQPSRAVLYTVVLSRLMNSASHAGERLIGKLKQACRY